MKKYYPHNLALQLAIYITVFYELILIFYFIFFGDKYAWVLLLSGIVLLFPASYLLIRRFVESFINKKLRLLFKTIHDVKTPKRKQDIKKNWYEDAEKEVVQWAEDQKTEIDHLKEQEKYRREFMGNVFHELKTPVFNIQGYVLTLLDGGLEDTTINMEYLRRAEKSINRMIAIVNDLDEISKLESGAKKLDYQKFDILALSQEVFETYEFKAAEKNISLMISHSAHGSVYVYADKEKIRQVLNNLTENSIKYGTSHGRTKITFYDMDDHILTEISDNGIGIMRDDIPRLFERFFRTSDGRNADNTGSGLGLAIVKHIIEAHNETINVRSSPGLGTTFGFTLKKP